MLMRIEGPSERARAALAEAESYDLHDNADTPTIFHKLIDDMRDMVTKSTAGAIHHDTSFSCGCTYDVWKCKDHSEAKCDCDHVGTILLCDVHHEGWADRYDIDELRNRIGSPSEKIMDQTPEAEG